MPFTEGQRVRMLIETSGSDENDEECEYPAGTLATVYMVDDRGIYHVTIGEGDEQIANSFDFGAEAEEAMEAVS